ncbi:cytochrome c3 family protein [Tsuneonella sp. YG55]|uniref:Cytochrome c3 family protein n=1 Tax=Tsuneonella litorea TaxID=2976475 RepID=A0A9X2VZ16_9SPHN|nr:cytochrome c3 family protein [Tsuneonella litorea]MCT2557474.1 cytochrome c3 family protein [Tsuneonella litorea]
MSFRIRQIQTTATGREIVREREVTGDRLTIGRSAENDVAIPDLAVEQHHVVVSRGEGRALAFEAAGTLGFTLDGRTRTSETVRDGGAELVLGAFRLDFAAGPGEEIEVTVRRMEERESGAGAGTHGFRLTSTWLPGKRPVAWALLIAIFLAFLAVPIWTNLGREPVKPDYRKPGQTAMDASWSTGKLSLAHHGLEDNCEACHVQPFVAVRDGACLTCHEDIGDHSAKPRLSLARGPLSWGDQVQRDIADVFHKPGAGACTDCHTEHEGEGRMQPPAQKFCADCHGSMDKRLKTPLGNAADFGKAHPQFQAAVLTGQGDRTPTRVSLDGNPREFNGLKFPHELHLSASGGVAQMARRLGAGKGYGETLECSDCHRPTADGVRFQPVDMETNCGSCHSLVYDRVGGTFRTLRHGDISQMRADLAAADRVPRRPIASGRKRPGAYSPGGLYYGNFAPPQRASVPLASRMLSTRGVCTECHFPSGDGVMPVVQPKRYIEHGWFDHEAHKREKCTTCHAAPASDSATDVLLPGIKTCRTCHLGESAAKPKIPSTCAMCHSYHPRGDAAPARVGKDADERKSQT